MTEEEARKVFGVVSTADHGCSVCVRYLVKRLEKEFPEWPWEEWEDDWLDE